MTNRLDTPAPKVTLTLRSRTFDFSRTVAVMAIVNRTPDSFFDPGISCALPAAIDHAMQQVSDGADIIDVGGVKAAPGAVVSVDEELERVIPFVEAFCQRSPVTVSVDTFRAKVAATAVAAGADIVNDTSGMSEPDIADVVAAHPGTALVLMHPGGTVRTRPFRATYEPDVTTDVLTVCRQLIHQATERGVPEQALIVDPGHDFGKNTFHSLELTRRLDELAGLGRPVLVAMSNKDFLGETLDLALDERLEASLAAAVVAVMRGASLVRVHQTRETVRAIRMVEAILGWTKPAAPARGLD